MIDTQDPITQPLPMPGAGSAQRNVRVDSIARSLTNPRKHFDATKLQELADSIAASGVHQPILIRPLPAHRLEDTHREARANKAPAPEFELVAGERRWRACQLAKLQEVPALIRPMTDAQALEAQVIENLQREDVTELEEAEGYQVLMQHQGINAEQVGAKIGKSRGYVYSRLKILDLCQQGRDALRDGLLDFSCALPIARIADEQLQIKALEEALDEGYDGERMSARAIQRMVRDDYMLDLSKAPFDTTDATLCPSAGACSSCAHRTGANPDLFHDVDSADVCTKPPCYHEKEEAHAVALRKKAELLGSEIIDGRAAKELLPNAYTTNMDGYLRLDHKHDSPIGGKTLRSVLSEVMAAQNIQPTIVVNPHNSKDMIAVLTTDQVRELLSQASGEEAQQAKQQQALDAQRAAKYDQEAKEEAEREAYENGWREDVVHRVVAQLQQPNDMLQAAVAIIIARTFVSTINTSQAQELCKLLDMGKVAPVAAIKERAEEQPFAIAGAVIAIRDSHYAHWLDDKEGHVHNPQLMELAKASGIDVDAIKAQTKANQRAAKTAAEPVKSGAPKADIPHDPAAPAGASRARGKAKKAPAAHASEVPKTSAAHASALIAAALQEADSGAGAQGNEAAPVAAEAAQELTPSAMRADDQPGQGRSAEQTAEAPSAADQYTSGAHPDTALCQACEQCNALEGLGYCEACCDDLTSNREAETAEATGPAWREGTRVRIKADAQLAAKHDRLRTEVGELRYQVGNKRNVWRVAFPSLAKRGIAVVESLSVEAMEVVA